MGKPAFSKVKKHKLLISSIICDTEVIITVLLINERANQINSDVFLILSQDIQESSDEPAALNVVAESEDEGDLTPTERDARLYELQDANQEMSST